MSDAATDMPPPRPPEAQAAVPAASEAKSASPSSPQSPKSSLLNCWMMISFAAAIGGAAFLDYRIVQEFAFLRTACLVAGIAAGVGATFCLGGAMHYVDEILATPAKPAWYWRWLLVTQRRLLMFGQLAATALVLWIVATFIFNLKIPGPDYAILYHGGDPDARVVVQPLDNPDP